LKIPHVTTHLFPVNILYHIHVHGGMVHGQAVHMAVQMVFHFVKVCDAGP